LSALHRSRQPPWRGRPPPDLLPSLLQILRHHLQPDQHVLVGVVALIDTRVATIDEVRRFLEWSTAATTLDEEEPHLRLIALQNAHSVSPRAGPHVDGYELLRRVRREDRSVAGRGDAHTG